MTLSHSGDSDLDACAVHCIHPQTLRRVGPQMPARSDLEQLAEFYKLLGDGTRLSILSALSASEMCVCDLCALLNMNQPAVSHQLRTLKQARIVQCRREGKMIYYSLADGPNRKLMDLGIRQLKAMKKKEENEKRGND